MPGIYDWDKRLIAKNDSSIKEYSFTRRGLKDEDLPEIVKLLNQNSFIETLSLKDNSIRNPAELAKLSYVKSIDFSRNNLNGTGLLQLLQKKQFTHLDLYQNNLKEESGKLIAENTRQLRLNIERNPISKEIQAQIAAKITANNQQLSGASYTAMQASFNIEQPIESIKENTDAHIDIRTVADDVFEVNYRCNGEYFRKHLAKTLQDGKEFNATPNTRAKVQHVLLDLNVDPFDSQSNPGAMQIMKY